jgi:hypothetical protein
MALPDWVRTSTDAVSKAFRLRRTGRQDLIDAVERGDMTLEAALEEAEAKEQQNQWRRDVNSHRRLATERPMTETEAPHADLTCSAGVDPKFSLAYTGGNNVEN